jgi:hypothetical protein
MVERAEPSIGFVLLAVAPAAAPLIGASERRPSLKKTGFSLAAAASLVSRWGAVSSVTRSSEHNPAFGGAARSFHLVGRVIDVVRRYMGRMTVPYRPCRPAAWKASVRASTCAEAR